MLRAVSGVQDADAVPSVPYEELAERLLELPKEGGLDSIYSEVIDRTKIPGRFRRVDGKTHRTAAGERAFCMKKHWSLVFLYVGLCFFFR